MIGIYKITNKINGKCYIGQAVNIKARWKNHKKDAFWQNGPCYEYPLYRAIRKHGIENFDFEVVEECSIDVLNELEIFYITKYDSYENGYNQTRGGSCSSHPIKLNDSAIDAIIFKLKTTKEPNTVIAKEFNVSECMIRAINLGNYWTRSGENYPIRKTRSNESHNKLSDKTTSSKTTVKNKKTNKCKQCGIPIWPTSSLCKRCSNKNKNESRKIQRPSKMELAKMVFEVGFEAVGKNLGVSGKSISKWCKDCGLPPTREELKRWYCTTIGIEYIPPKSQRNKKPWMRPVKQLDLNSGETLNTFKSIKKANESLNIKGKSHISDVCLGKRKSAHGYGWQYA